MSEDRSIFLKNIVKNRSYILGTMDDIRIFLLLNNLCDILESGIEGDIVELGCFMGKTSILITQVLNYYKSNKKFYVYDSFEGLPERSDNDYIMDVPHWAKKGSLNSSMDNFIKLYEQYNLELPIINKGYFNEIDDSLYPNKIAFAFLDGDLYTSIYDSLNKIYFKVVPQGVIHVDDYGHGQLPGVKKACDTYLDENKILDKFVNIGRNQGMLIKHC